MGTFLIAKRSANGAVLCAALFLAGCASMESHDVTATQVQQATAGGTNFDAGLAQLDTSYKSASSKKELLYNLEKGELLRLAGKYQDSTSAFLTADERVKEWESTNADGAKLAGTLGAALISERLKTYEGHDYEKVWLTTRLALNRISQGDFDTARIDIKRTHEREAIIARVRTVETAKAEEEAKKNGAKTEAKELNGYPTQSLNDPEVLSLKNGYQNALSHYLAGFLYEALNEPSLAAPGYRQAIELHPGTDILDDGLKNLDQRVAHHSKEQSDVLFVIETGVAPARVSKSFAVPVPTGSTMPIVPISYPVIEPSNEAPLAGLNLDGNALPFAKIVDLNVMARRELKDEMPGMVLRGITRAVTKGVMQDQLQKNAGLFGAIAGAVFAVATEQADDRMWRMLPDRVYIARATLPVGEHELVLNGQNVGKVKIAGQYEVVPVRVYQSSYLLGEPGILGQPAAIAAAK